MWSRTERAEKGGKRGDMKTLYEITTRLSGRFQSTCKPVRNVTGLLVRTVEEKMHRWREHLERVIKHEAPPNPPAVEPSDELNIRTGRITRSEIKNPMKKLKNAKAARCDNIPITRGNLGWGLSVRVLLDLSNQIWSKEQIPEERKKGLLIKLPKKGDPSHCKNWHGLTLLNMASKVLCRVILERITTALDENSQRNKRGFELVEAVRTK